MNPALTTALLLAGTVLLLLLPLLPALIEFGRKTDALPLRVIQDHAGEIRHFSQSFREFVQSLQSPLRDCAARGATASGKLRDGSEYILVGDSNIAFLKPEEIQRGFCDRVVVCAGAFSPVANMAFAKEMHMHGDLNGAAGNTFRALLAERSVKLGSRTTVLRWLHAVGAIEADRNCTFHGRLSSDKSIRLGPHASFERINAPRVEFACREPLSPDPDYPHESQLDKPLRRVLLRGDLQVPAGMVLRSSVVASGKVHIGKGAHIHGSLKSNGDLIIEEGARVDGSAISARTMKIGPKCRIHGPVLAEHGLWVERETHLGASQQPTTVSAPQINLKPGVVVFGTVWAKERGMVDA